MGFDQKTRLALLSSQLARRAIRMTAQDEYGSFARWVARLPVTFTNYFNDIIRYLDPHTDDEPSEEEEG